MATALEPGQAGGLFVSEMITTRALVERNAKTLNLIRFEADEFPRSIQLYGVDPAVVGRAVRMIVEDDLADHIDLNFGCPVPKVTRKGGGSALPWRIGLFDDIVTTAVREARGAVPVTVKMRVGIDAEHVTYREAGLRAQDAGVAQVALHGRTAADFYSGQADWATIADLVDALDIPVLGNGDIWEADDALRMVGETGCAGVVVGRGCLGRPWLFADLAAAFAGRPERIQPTSARSRRPCAATPNCWPAGSVSSTASPTSASTSPGTSKASPSVANCAGRWRWPRRWPNWTSTWRRWIPTSRSPRRFSATHADARPERARCHCPRGGWTPADRGPCRPAPNWPTAAADRSVRVLAVAAALAAPLALGLGGFGHR